MQSMNTATMDFEVLSRYDDLFTDIFLDSLFLWFDTIKMNVDHRRPRVSVKKILSIIQKNILDSGRVMDAVNELLELDYFKHYLALKNQKQVQEFIQHMKRYLYMYMPNAGYELGDTRRYVSNGRKVEAALMATKDWMVGDEMKLLTGMIACLDPESDAEIMKGNRDFSVMWSTRKNCSCLFLGPARFANHDCDSNCKFISQGQNSITFKVLKEIKCGEEITVYYGKHYFGENNCECRCVTCERLSMGCFAPPVIKESTPIDKKEDDQCGTRRSTRKRKPALHEDYYSEQRVKRTSLHLSPVDSLEELIGESISSDIHTDTSTMKIENDLTMDDETTHMSPIDVMRINFICHTATQVDTAVDTEDSLVNTGEFFTKGSPKNEDELSDYGFSPESELNDRRGSDSSRLDLLASAVMEAPYLDIKDDIPIYHHHLHSYEDGKTVVVNPIIHRDAAQRVMLQMQSPLGQQYNIMMDKISSNQPVSPISPSVGSSTSKADSAVSLSPQFSDSGMVKKEDKEDHPCWRREIDDTLFNDEYSRIFDEILDDVSDLSSVSSRDLSHWNDFDFVDKEGQEEKLGSKSGHDKKSMVCDPLCIACSRPLRRQELSEDIGVDISVTNELATWSWSPGAYFANWKVKRCPRCERHFSIFRQEWPNRKPKKVNNNQSKKSKKKNGKTDKKHRKKSPPSSLSPSLSPSCTEPIPPQPSPHLLPISFQIQDDPSDLNYIPPSPLSEPVYEDEDDIL